MCLYFESFSFSFIACYCFPVFRLLLLLRWFSIFIRSTTGCYVLHAFFSVPLIRNRISVVFIIMNVHRVHKLTHINKLGLISCHHQTGMRNWIARSHVLFFGSLIIVPFLGGGISTSKLRIDLNAFDYKTNINKHKTGKKLASKQNEQQNIHYLQNGEVYITIGMPSLLRIHNHANTNTAAVCKQLVNGALQNYACSLDTLFGFCFV